MSLLIGRGDLNFIIYLLYRCRGKKPPTLIPTNCFVLRTTTILPNIRISWNYHPSFMLLCLLLYAGYCSFFNRRTIFLAILTTFCYVNHENTEITRCLMPIRGYIIEKYNTMTNAYTCNRLVQEASALDMDLQIVGIHDTAVSPHGVINHGKILKPVDFVINRYKWGREKDAINALATRSYNPLTAYNIYINKFEQVRRLHSKAFLIPKYLLGTSRLPFSSIVEQLGLPFVGKGLESSMGEEIVCIRDKASYEELSLNYPSSKEWLFEEFISESYGRDLRFYSIRGEAVACMQRTSQGDFRANVALGASVEPYPVTSGIRTIAADIYEQTGLDFLGIDLLFGREKPYFCEINVMPGLEGIEKASGINVAGKIIETIQSDFTSKT